MLNRKRTNDNNNTKKEQPKKQKVTNDKKEEESKDELIDFSKMAAYMKAIKEPINKIKRKVKQPFKFTFYEKEAENSIQFVRLQQPELVLMLDRTKTCQKCEVLVNFFKEEHAEDCPKCWCLKSTTDNW